MLQNTVRIEDNKLVGYISDERQFCHGSRDVGSYTIKVIYDGADATAVAKWAFEQYVIHRRKTVKDKNQAMALADGETVAQITGQAPIDEDMIARIALRKRGLSDEVIDQILSGTVELKSE